MTLAKYISGIKRFYKKYPEYHKAEIEQEEIPLGVGAPMIPIGRQSEKGIDNEVVDDVV